MFRFRQVGSRFHRRLYACLECNVCAQFAVLCEPRAESFYICRYVLMCVCVCGMFAMSERCFVLFEHKYTVIAVWDGVESVRLWELELCGVHDDACHDGLCNANGFAGKHRTNNINTIYNTPILHLEYYVVLYAYITHFGKLVHIRIFSKRRRKGPLVEPYIDIPISLW